MGGQGGHAQVYDPQRLWGRGEERVVGQTRGRCVCQGGTCVCVRAVPHAPADGRVLASAHVCWGCSACELACVWHLCVSEWWYVEEKVTVSEKEPRALPGVPC